MASECKLRDNYCGIQRALEKKRELIAKRQKMQTRVNHLLPKDMRVVIPEAKTLKPVEKDISRLVSNAWKLNDPKQKHFPLVPFKNNGMLNTLKTYFLKVVKHLV